MPSRSPLRAIRRVAPAAFLLAAGTVRPCAAQPRLAPTEVAAAEDVARRAFAALADARWAAVPPLVHPEVVREFRAQQLMAAREMERARTDTARWSATTRDPSMPPEVAAWFQRQQREAESRHGSYLEQQFVGVTSLVDLVLLPADAMLARWLEAQDPAYRVQVALRQQPDSLRERVPAGMFERRPTREVVGSVVENDSTVQVLFRQRGGFFSGPGGSELSVATVRRAPDGWRLWTGWSPHPGDGVIGFRAISVRDMTPHLREVAARVVTWPRPDSATGALAPADARVVPGRATIEGYQGGTEPPRALVVEVTPPAGRPVRVEIPASAFRDIHDLLEEFAGLYERQQLERRTPPASAAPASRKP